MRLAMLFLALPALVSMATPMESGTGDYRPPRYSVLHGAKAPPLSKIGNDVLRFSRTPALGGSTYIFEIHAVDGDWAIGSVQLFYGHPRNGWQAVGSIPVELRRADFEAVMRQVDAALARGEPDLSSPDGEVMILCTDGPGYVTERRHGGKSLWLAGFCGDNHPNDEIAKAVEGVIGEQLNRFFRR